MIVFAKDDLVELARITAALQRHLPAALRWSGAVARRLRQFNVALSGKSSGSATTDALTLADLSVQELLVAALRDCDPVFRTCRIEAEESTGDLDRFASTGMYTIALDPIDGTKQYRDHTGNGYSVILTLRSRETVHYSLVFVPESGPHGAWVEVADGRIVCGPDDPDRPAYDVLRSMVPIEPAARGPSRKIYLIGFQDQDAARAQSVTATGLQGVPQEEMPGCLYELLARGDFAGSLIHSPNVYDFPAGLHIARTLGGDALWVHNREPVHFGELWLDERADMLRLPGIVACSFDREILGTLCDLARDWNPIRYAD